MTGRLLMLSAVLVTAIACGQHSTPPAPVDDGRFGAPRVTAPKDVAPFAADPCSGPLTGARLDALGLSSRGQGRTTVTGERSCDWRSREGGQYVSLIVIPNRDVLVDTYRVRQFPVFEPLTITGLPATREQSSPSSSSCVMTIGTAPQQGYIVDVSGGASGGPCDAAQRIAEEVATALPSSDGK
ncbi:hypothetical protein Acsp06_21050 [Actinomycetospora sp. NBRC 106375]|uniref:DUF3558 family protein n=1 Tax=Actinomycetospora sp. NBRC 106375 TaxID=3032207 RepID=UPI0024A4BD4F|nr:DUF3558 family protein [Actinomycetospora sp. NBRC 106375]GLZ45920.1 hypothetical protein Acsp06_21050 [Actinomycetospora sp. NBRC 106375]